MMQNINFFIFGITLNACVLNGVEHRMNEAQLVGAPGHAAISISNAQRSLTQAEKKYELELKAYHDAQFAQALAAGELEKTKTRLKINNKLQTTALSIKDEQKESTLKAQASGLALLREAQRAEIAWRKSSAKRAKAEALLAQAYMWIKDAELEVQKAEAALLGKSTETIDLNLFQTQVAKLMKYAATLEKQSGKAWASIQKHRDAYERAFAEVPQNVAGAAAALKISYEQNELLRGELNNTKNQVEALQKEKEEAVVDADFPKSEESLADSSDESDSQNSAAAQATASDAP